uniref:Uncharacterized protein n=1 Tax=Spodoptera frugiperda nuclear polyhedrosis virus TaxID=10455 RepID=A0A7G3W7M9_NPVSF|nr:hypothetical protein [Spodoptera frugiperda multiple nucleopolyhedrovirus]
MTTTTTTTTGHCCCAIKVFANDAELVPVAKFYNAAEKLITLDYNIFFSCSELKVILESSQRDKFLQALFQCGNKYMCIVNRSRDKPILFDGFVNEFEDECKTKSFNVGNLKELNELHGLCVREMARAMESPTILHVYVNEAIISDHLAKHDHGADYEQLLNKIRVNIDGGGIANVIAPPRCSKKFNKTKWAPVSCKTGKHLLTAILTFRKIIHNQ